MPGTPPERETVAVDPAVLQGDARMEALIAPYAPEVARLKAPIGTATEDMGRGSKELGAWMADVVREAASRAVGEPVDAAFVNKGGIRSDLPAGPVSVYTMMNIMPFDNEIDVLTLSGEQAIALAEVFAPQNGRFPLSGMTIRVAADGSLDELLIGGAPVVASETYTIATSNYLTGGGDQLDIMATFPAPRTTSVRIRDAMIEAAERLTAEGRTLDPPTDADRYLSEEALVTP